MREKKTGMRFPLAYWRLTLAGTELLYCNRCMHESTQDNAVVAEYRAVPWCDVGPDDTCRMCHRRIVETARDA